MGRAVEEVNMKSKQFFFVRTLEYLILGGLVVAFYAVLLTPQISYAAPICPNGITPVLYRGSYVCPRPQSPVTPQNLENSVRAPTTEGARCDAGKEPAAQWTGGTTMISVKCVAPGETPTTASPVAGTPETQKPVDCSSTSDYWFNLPICIVRASLAGIGSFFMWFGVKAVVLAGGLFELMLDYGIIKFGAMLKNIESGINDGWTALRDIANIIIIGLFVFIAVNIILGVKDFGDKKRVAHVLIVAVLINFSLLFTKVIVDASNFTAYQFYNQMIGGLEKRTETIGGVEVGSSVIAVKFMQLLGVQGISDSQDKLLKIGEDNKNAFYALGYGFISLIFLLATSAVFLYGAFLIVSRAVLIVFLMLTSAVAFATWLIPQQYVQSGFSKWWESLLKAAFFAPILIALVWITTVVSDTLVKSGLAKGGTLGKLAENASSEANIAALFSMILILGLLFAAFATANAFSKTISGFRFAQGGVLTALGVASRVGGIAGRFTLGAAAGGAFKGLRNAGASDYWAGRMAMRPLRWLGQKTYDPMSVGTVRRTAERLGGVVLGGDKFGDEGYSGGRRRQARKAEELARAMRPPESVRNEMANQAAQGMRDMVSQERGAIDH